MSGVVRFLTTGGAAKGRCSRGLSPSNFHSLNAVADTRYGRVKGPTPLRMEGETSRGA